MEQIKKTGIMGGTFNPIHLGHLLLAEQAREFTGLDEVMFMPSGNSYMKDSSEIASGEHRLAMTELAIEDNPFFSLSTLEMERGGATYTCDTLRILHQKHPRTQFYFILGADNLFSIENWKDPEIILGSCHLIVTARGDSKEADIEKQASHLEQKYHTQVILLPERKIDISSSEIRERLSKGKSVRYMVPDKVLTYIKEHQLYR